MHGGKLKIALERLTRTGRVLYVAAHPDDENTRLISYLGNHEHLDVAYLSMTRGGGGQNLIGPEQAELLAVIRTQELLAARRLDGGRQFFTRARDFGYSKTPEETLAKWDREQILADVVWVIRSFRPDVIVTRFTEAGPSHGHHTASARLARAAFEAAADPARFPEQLTRGVQVFKPQRLLLNVPRWGRSDDDTTGMMALDVGGFDARLGASYGELAAQSRTMHKSQGFGSAGRRGPALEYFQALIGDMPKQDLLEGGPGTWSRFEGGAAVDAALAKVVAAFDVEHPERMLAPLLDARASLVTLQAKNDVPRVRDAIAAASALIADVAGLFVRVQADRPEAAPGSAVKLEAEVIARLGPGIRLEQIAWPDKTEAVGKDLTVHAPETLTRTVTVHPEAPVSAPHWLRAPITGARYPIAEPTAVSDPEPPSPLRVEFTFSVGKQTFTLMRDAVHAQTDSVLGERIRPFSVVPKLMVTPEATTQIFAGGAPQQVRLTVRAGADGARGEVGLELPKGWRSKPKAVAVSLAQAGDLATVSLEITPPKAGAAPAEARPFVKTKTRAPAWRYDMVDYPHLPPQAILRPAGLRLVPVDISVPEGRIGYVQGSGDAIPELLRQVGLQVEELDDDTVRRGDFSGFRTIVLGVRALNTRDVLGPAHPALMRFVEAGGTVVVQYNTSNRWRRLESPVGPYPIEIDRGRVTDETAEVTVLAPDHPVLTRPHHIEPADFAGWVQERGLYFAKSWDEKYKPILAMADPGDDVEQGSLLVAEHGEGVFVYTGLSFFRQLPAGVPGAYRLLINLISARSKP